MTNRGESHLFLDSGGSNLITKASNLKVMENCCDYRTVGQIKLEAWRWSNGRCTGLRIKQSGFEPWLQHCAVFLGKTLVTVIVPFFIQVYKWVLANLMMKVGVVPSCPIIMLE